MKTKIGSYIKTWENRCYSSGIPDEAPKRLEQLNKVPSYRMIVLAILRNDYPLKTLGFEPTKSKYYHELKRIEISQRKNSVIQLKLF
jgi:predicted phosphoadenosine phosphosulfate sulfurtransferase